MEIGIIAGDSLPNRVIGVNGNLPWKNVDEIRKPDNYKWSLISDNLSNIKSGFDVSNFPLEW